MNENESIFQTASYYQKMGEIAGKAERQCPEHKFQAIQLAGHEFDRRKLTMHKAAFIEGFVSTVRGGYFLTEKDHIEPCPAIKS